MRKIILNEAQIKVLVKEMLCSTGSINEISSADAYNKFYSNKFSKEQYDRLMTNAPTMTPIHKVVLDYMIRVGGWDGELVNALVKLWTEGSENAKRYAIDSLPSTPAERNGMGRWQIEGILNHAIKAKHFTEGEFTQGGYHILKETPSYRITCTTSYSASKKYFGASHWCTASDVGGHFNGFRMFGNYTGTGDDAPDEPAILVQITNKEDPKKAIQVQVFDDGTTGDICKFDGSSISYNALMKFLANEGFEGESLIDIIGGDDVYRELLEKTQESYSEECSYWDKRYEDALNKKRQKMMSNEGKYEPWILQCITDLRKKTSVDRKIEFFNRSFSPSDHPSYGPYNFEISQVETVSDNNVMVFNVIFKGIDEEEKLWVSDAYGDEDFRVLNGFNNQVWFVSDDGSKVLKKIKGGFAYSSDGMGNLAEFCHGDWYVDDVYGNIDVISLLDGNIKIKDFHPVQTMELRRIEGKTENGHPILYFMEPAKSSNNTEGGWYCAGLDTITTQYLGHLTIPKVKKEDLYGWMKLLDYKEDPNAEAYHARYIRENKKTRSPKDAVKAISKANRDMDIEDHGKPTVFRTTMTKNPKAYTRKIKHKGNEIVDEGNKRD